MHVQVSAAPAANPGLWLRAVKGWLDHSDPGDTEARAEDRPLHIVSSNALAC